MPNWKGLMKGFWDTFLVPIIGDVSVAVWLRTWWEKRQKKEEEISDKRGIMLRRFRIMNDNKINLDNLWRRHAACGKKDYRFVENLGKICEPKPGDPAKPVPQPGAVGQPQDDWEADMKWLNDLNDAEFQDRMEFLYHSRLMSIWQDVADSLAPCRRWIGRNFVAMCAGMGAFGLVLLRITRMVANAVIGFLEWVSRYVFILIIVVIVALILSGPLALAILIVAGIFRNLRGGTATTTTTTTGQRHAVGAMSIFTAFIGVMLFIWAYKTIVPVGVDKDLYWAALAMLFGAFCFWKTRAVRRIALFLLVVFTVILFLGGRTAAKGKVSSAGINTTTGVGKWFQDTMAMATSKEMENIREGQAQAMKATTPTTQSASSNIAGGEAAKTTPPQPSILEKIAAMPDIKPDAGLGKDFAPTMKACYYSERGNKSWVSCIGSVHVYGGYAMNMLLMDSNGTVETPLGSTSINFMSMGGMMAFSGGGNLATVEPDHPSTFVLTFPERTGRAKDLTLTLWVREQDVKSTPFTFAQNEIPVID